MIRWICATALACLSLPACGGDTKSSSAETTASLCESTCSASDTRACPGEQSSGAACRSECASTFDQVPATCAAKGRAALKCGAAVPAQELICTTGQGSDLKPGVCEAELQALLTCLGVPSGDGGTPADGG